MNGLDHCHRNGFAHRDLKPENIMLDHLSVLKIIDFGFATNLKGDAGDYKLHEIVGSSQYMAPEMYH